MADKTDDVSTKAKNSDPATSRSRGKAPAAKRSQPDHSISPPPETSSSSSFNQDLVLECLKNIQQSQNSLLKRIEAVESSNTELYYEYEEYDDYDEQSGPPSPKRSKVDDDNASQSNDPPVSVSRFAGLSKKFKPTEVCSGDVDPGLAANVNELFRKGMDEELYDKTVKDDNCPRPENCDGLLLAKMNKLVWDVMSQQSRSMDKKMQAIAQSIVKAGVFLTKTMNRAAEVEKKLTEKDHDADLADIIEGCNDSLALLGHANYQVNMSRRDLLRPELRKEYVHLCTHSLPVTRELFGDDISKTAKEIEDSAKIGHKMSGQPAFRGGYRGRSGYRGRYRGAGPSRGGSYGGSTLRYSTGYGPATSRYSNSTPAKNSIRRGGARGQQKV